MTAVREGQAELGGYGAVYSHLYFTGLHQLMKVCATGKNAARLSEAVGSEASILKPLPALTKNVRYIECLGVTDRWKLVDMARYLLGDWPRRFILLCESQKVWSSALLRELNPVPFWYWSVVHDYLYRVSYKRSDAEIRSAIAYLERSSASLCKKSISRCLGTNNDLFRKRKSKELLALVGSSAAWTALLAPQWNLTLKVSLFSNFKKHVKSFAAKLTQGDNTLGGEHIFKHDFFVGETLLQLKQAGGIEATVYPRIY
jgi:hypothetical protein